jgi:WD40 repeat protein/uncharacterized protein (DUF1778 family)
VAFTPDGKSLVAGDGDGRVVVWDLAMQKERFVLDSHGWIGRSMALSPDGKIAAAGTVYNVIRQWDVTTGKPRFSDPPGHDAPIHAVAFSPDGKLLVTGGENRQVHLWDAMSGRHLRPFEGQSAKAIAFSSDGKRLAAGWRWDPNLRVWDVATGEEKSRITHDASRGVHGVAFSPDRKALISLDELAQGGAARLNVWDTTTGQRRHQILISLQPECLAVSPDGKLAVIGGNADLPLRLCDIERGKELTQLPSKQHMVVSTVFSPDGRILATGGIDRTVCLWETASYRLIAQFPQQDRSVATLAFSPGGRMLASADGGPVTSLLPENPGHKIYLWELASGRKLVEFSGHDSDVTSLAFSPDEQRLVSGLSNGTALLWDLATRAGLGDADRVELTLKERDALWSDLASDEGSKAFAAVWKLGRYPTVVAYLQAHLQPATSVSAKQLNRWIADLDNPAFAEREKASRALERLTELAQPALRKALTADPSPEAQRRIKALLAKLDGPVSSNETLRSLRAVAVLEHLATPEARRLLEKLAAGAPEARLTREAKATLERLSLQSRRGG